MKKYLFLLILLFQTAPVFALTCATQPAELSYLEYPFVFVGTVTAIEKDADIMATPPTPALVTVAVDESLKGDMPAKVFVDGIYFGNGRFEKGGRYLFYVHEKDGRYSSAICGPTVPLGDFPDVSITGSASEQLERIARLKAALAGEESAFLEGAFAGNMGTEDSGRLASFNIIESADGAFEYNGFDQNGTLIEFRRLQGSDELIKHYGKGEEFAVRLINGEMVPCAVPD